MSSILIIDTLSTMRIDVGFISPSCINGHLCGFLEQAGIDYDVVFTVPQEDGEIGILKNNLPAYGEFEQLLSDLSPRVVALFHDPELVHLALPVAEKVRSTVPDALLCTGNSIASVLPEEYQKRGFDYICDQDVFASFVTLVKKILAGERPPQGVIALPWTVIDLDGFPFIAKKFFEPAQPQWSFPDGRIMRFGLIMGSFGCTGGCTHCHNSAFWGRTWRPMGATRICAEIEQQRELLQAKTFYLGDFNFLPNIDDGNSQRRVHPLAAQRLRELDERLPEHIRFISTTRPDTISILQQQDLALLERYLRRMSICFMGIESFSDVILSQLNRKITTQMIRDAVHLLADRGISIVASFIVGNSHETWDTFQETENFIMHELPASSVPILNIMTPFPGTRFYEEMKEKGLLLPIDISRFNGQHLIFKHPFFKQGELEDRIKQFYYRFYTERYTG